MNLKLLNEFQKKIHYQFKDNRLLFQALTHSSYSNEYRLHKLSNNERLEFLGDAVLELVSSNFLFKHYRNMSEGELSKKRASLVCEPTLALCAKEMDLGRFLYLGKGEDHTGGRERDSVLSDALEAVIGAIYLDGGLGKAADFIHSFILNDIENKSLFRDCKTILQELIQSQTKKTVEYEVIDEIGPEHNRKFVVQAVLGEQRLGTGSGRTKQAAGQEAAYKTLIQLKAVDNKQDKNKN